MKIASDYLKIILSALIAAVLLRILETVLVLINFGFQNDLFLPECFGLLVDIFFTNTLFLLLFPLYYLLHKFSSAWADTVFVFLICALTIASYFILQYFTYQLLPLDIFLYKHTLEEVQLTVETSPVSHWRTFSPLVLLLLLLCAAVWYIKKKHWSKKTIFTGYSLSLIGVAGCVFTQSSELIGYNLLSLNKAHYFCSQSFAYFTKEEDDTYTEKDGLAFQDLYPSHSYLNTTYPLLHTFKKDNVLGPFFNEFDTAPNVVMLIVEGLNDDYIHPYHGIDLMPYLSQLRDQSLYWNRCFTLGERSFAAVPSLTGGLPYGEIGFTQLDIYPNHLSLVSILKSNQYHTSFFYGQGSWFHSKGRYFEFNHVDEVVDNSRFNEKYKKITVGANQFFWGYNDKDLFNQSLEIIDQRPLEKRLDIYFTGTSHSPFIISDTAYYETKFAGLLTKVKNKKDVLFFNTYKKYILSELFVNDAIENFMTEYKKRPAFENTIFIITGDHPMSELPRANDLKKYHVPLIIYSPKLKAPKVFSQTASHLDIYESLLSLLSEYEMNIPAFSTSIGNKLNTTNESRDEKIAFMNGNREVVDYLSNDDFISGHQLYTIQKDLSLTKSTDKFRETKLKNELHIFNKVTRHACRNDKLLSDSIYCQSLNYHLLNSQRYDSLKVQLEDHELIAMEVANEELLIEVSLTYEKIPDQLFGLIFELKDSTGKTLVWQKLGVANENKKIQRLLKLPKQNTPNQSLTFKAFLNNPAKQEVKLKDLRLLIYQK